MIKTIALLLLLLGFGLFGVWLKQHDFVISAEYNDYLIETSAARLLIVFLIFTISFYGIMKLIFWVKNSPARILGRVEKNKREEGLKNLMKGFSALAAGDVEHAERLANRAEKALPEQPLIKLLKAQIAVISNKPIDAEKLYGELQENEDAKFIGYRGLISQAIENQETDRALELAEDLLKLNKQSVWINESVIDLSFRNAEWEKAEIYTQKAYDNGSIPKIEGKVNLGLIAYLRAKEFARQGDNSEAKNQLEISLKKNDKFLPALLLLVAILMSEKEEEKAAKLIRKYWKTLSHPSLAEAYLKIYEGLVPDKKLKKIKQLVKANPETIDSKTLLAQAYISAGEREKAKQELQLALKKRETKIACNLMAQIDDEIDWEKRAQNAEFDKAWHCLQTGKIYNDWQLYSDAGHFNSIIWDYPQKYSDYAITKLKNEDNFLLIK